MTTDIFFTAVITKGLILSHGQCTPLHAGLTI